MQGRAAQGSGSACARSLRAAQRLARTLQPAARPRPGRRGECPEEKASTQHPPLGDGAVVGLVQAAAARPEAIVCRHHLPRKRMQTLSETSSVPLAEKLSQPPAWGRSQLVFRLRARRVWIPRWPRRPALLPPLVGCGKRRNFQHARSLVSRAPAHPPGCAPPSRPQTPAAPAAPATWARRCWCWAAAAGWRRRPAAAPPAAAPAPPAWPAEPAALLWCAAEELWQGVCSTVQPTPTAIPAPGPPNPKRRHTWAG